MLLYLGAAYFCTGSCRKLSNAAIFRSCVFMYWQLQEAVWCCSVVWFLLQLFMLSGRKNIMNTMKRQHNRILKKISKPSPKSMGWERTFFLESWFYVICTLRCTLLLRRLIHGRVGLEILLFSIFLGRLSLKNCNMFKFNQSLRGLYITNKNNTIAINNKTSWIYYTVIYLHKYFLKTANCMAIY